MTIDFSKIVSNCTTIVSKAARDIGPPHVVMLLLLSKMPVAFAQSPMEPSVRETPDYAIHAPSQRYVIQAGRDLNNIFNLTNTELGAVCGGIAVFVLILGGLITYGVIRCCCDESSVEE